ncbi:MAG: response regulator [Anaerolineae bacterium]|nr:response regulator [Anaerolineae bacterium]
METNDVKKIVYIEDDADMIDLVRLVLGQRQFNLIGATTGKQGLDIMVQDPPDLVLLDIMLPDMGGWAVYQQIKQDPLLQDIPVIAVTAQNAPIDRILGEHIAKVQAYVTKPFSPKELRVIVNEVLNLT